MYILYTILIDKRLLLGHFSAFDLFYNQGDLFGTDRKYGT